MKTKFIPILYQTDMVLACLDGTKTQTRRTKGLEKINDHYFQSLVHHATGQFTFVKNGNYNPKQEEIIEVKCPYGKPRDILWVRENFYTASNWDHWKPSQLKSLGVDVYFKADIGDYTISRPLSRGKMRPNIFLPFDYARIFLKIKDIRVERLNTISDADAIAEGIGRETWALNENVTIYTNYIAGKDFYSFSTYGWNFDKESHSAAVASYCSLWELINGDGSWNSNPWVWVIEFERIEKPTNFLSNAN